MGFRDYINDHPSCRAATQAEFLDGTVYREVRGADAFDHLLRSIRKGDVIRVYRPFLLAPANASPRKKRKVWAEREEAITARGGTVRSIDPPLSGTKLAMFAYEEIANVARGRAGKSKQGRPRKGYADNEIRVIEQFWPVRKGFTVDASVLAINERIAPRKITKGWLYSNRPVNK